MRNKRAISCMLAAMGLCGALVVAQVREPATRPAAGRFASTRAAATVPNPHWTTTQCRQCHEMRGNEVLPIAATQTDRVCLRCHDGRAARAEKHPVGRPIPTATAALPKGWPAAGGRLGCLTCHDLEPTAGHSRTNVPGRNNRNFLRGGPPTSMLAFCTKCHAATEQETRHNPHRMLSPTGAIEEQACLFCHTRVFKPEELTRRTGKRELKAAGLMLCIGCHTRHIDYFEPGHIGIKAPPSILAHMAADRAARDYAVGPGDTARSVQRGDRPTRLPLGPQQMVVCSTCHNPHQEGVFPAGSMLNLGAIPLIRNEQQYVAVRLGANLCSECHGK